MVCSETGKEIQGKARYYASYMQDDQLKEVHLSESAFSEPTQFDHMPLVYFRVTAHLKEGVTLPLIDLSKLHPQPDSPMKFGYTITTQALFYNNRTKVLELLANSEAADKDKKALLQLFKANKHEKVVTQYYQDAKTLAITQSIDTFLFDKKKEVLKYIRDKSEGGFDEEQKTIVEVLLSKGLSEENYAGVAAAFYESIQFFVIAKKMYMRISERGLKGCLPESLPYLRKKILNQLPPYIKNEFVQTLIGNLPSGDRFELTIRRRKAVSFAESGACDHDGTNSIFG